MYVGCTVNENENVGLKIFAPFTAKKSCDCLDIGFLFIWFVTLWETFIWKFFDSIEISECTSVFFPVKEIDSTHRWIGISHMSVFVRLLAIIYTCHYIQIHPKTRRINNIKFSSVIYGFVVATQKSKRRTLITADKIYLSHHSEQKRKQTSNNRKWPEVYKSQALKSFGGIVACKNPMAILDSTPPYVVKSERRKERTKHDATQQNI